MSCTDYSTEEIGKRGQEIYENVLRARIPSQHHGEFLIIDILSGTYEIDRDDLTASDRLLARQPKAILYGLRIGYSAAYRLAGRW